MKINIYRKFILLLSCSLCMMLFGFHTAHATAHTYDSLNRLTSVQYSNGHIIQYDYDANGNMTAMQYITPTDSDGDGLPDAWEQQIIDADSNDNINTFADVLASADFDSDGVSNGIEYSFNTDPTNALSPAIGDLNIDNELTLTDAVIALQVVTGTDNGNAIGAGVLRPEREIGLVDAIYILQVVSGERQ